MRIILLFSIGIFIANGGWILEWSDEFNGDTIDSSKWDFDSGIWGEEL